MYSSYRLRSRIRENEMRAVKSIYNVQVAEEYYRQQISKTEYTCDWKELSKSFMSPEDQRKLGACTGLCDNDLLTGIKAGYRLDLACSTKNGKVTQVTVIASPLIPGRTGNRSFCLDNQNGLRFGTSSSICKTPMSFEDGTK